MRTLNKFFLALATLAIGLVPMTAKANAIGDSVNLTYYYPDSSTVYYNSTTTAGAGTEFTVNGSTFNFLTVDVTATQIITTFLTTGQFTPSGSFVGYYLSDLTKAFNSISLDASSTSSTPTGLFLTNGKIGANFSGMNVTAGQKFVLNYTNAAAVTPEPSSLLLLGTGLVGVVGAARRRFAA